MKQKTNNRTFLFLKRTALWCAAGLLGIQSAQALEVERLRTEAVKNPVGIDVEKPMFSWRMDAGDERGVKQTAYEIAVFSDASCTEQVWTSGRVESDRQIDVAYEGDKLQPSTRYYWTVTVWDNKGGESTSTEKAYFETGLMGGGWNGARWIQATDTQLGTSEESIDHYSVEADFEVDNISTGLIFASADNKSHYYLWQINFETGYARLRPHIYRGDQQFATCLEEIDLRPLIDLQLHQTYHLRIEVDGQTRELLRFDGYCTYHRLALCGIADKLPDTVHTVKITVLPKEIDRREILFERNRADFDKNPEKYAPLNGYAGQLFLVGELVE